MSIRLTRSNIVAYMQDLLLRPVDFDRENTQSTILIAFETMTVCLIYQRAPTADTAIGYGLSRSV